MISLKVLLAPMGKYLVKDNYEQELRDLCHHFISQNKFDYIIGSAEEQRRKYKFSMETDVMLSPLLCTNSEKTGNHIIFNDEVKWYISSHSYELILQLVQGLFKEKKLSINNAKFEIQSLEVFETLDVSEFSEVS